MRISVSAALLSLLLACLLPLSLDIQPAEAGTIIVPDDYPTIQEAINNANEGDTIFVSSGVYYENVVVNRTVSLIGEDRNTTIIDGNHTEAYVVKITANNVKISEFTIQNTTITLDEYAVFISNSSRTLVDNNILRNFNIGVYAELSPNTTVTNNIVEPPEWALSGIKFSLSSNSTVSANTVSGQAYCSGGIWIELSDHCMVRSNYVSTHWGIVLASSNQSTVESNYVDLYHPTENGTEGIYLIRINDSFICNNTVVNSRWYGIDLRLDPTNNTVVGNNVLNSGLFGIIVDRIYGFSNVIFHNNFINNARQAHFFPEPHGDIWDNGYEGNFWSDYNGTDLDGDGIGDTPYVIDVNNTDNYPLMRPYMWWNVADVNYDFEVDIFDVVLVAGAYDSTPLDPNYNSHCDIAEPFVVIDIFDVVTAAINYEKTYPYP